MAMYLFSHRCVIIVTMNSYKSALKEGLSLELYDEEELIFQSSGKWLYPLFEVESFLNGRSADVSSLALHDHIDGKAAAMLTVHLGIRRVHSDILSKGALDIFTKYGVDISYDTLVEKIQCMTEALIGEDMSPKDAYKMLYERAFKR